MYHRHRAWCHPPFGGPAGLRAAPGTTPPTRSKPPAVIGRADEGKGECGSELGANEPGRLSSRLPEPQRKTEGERQRWTHDTLLRPEATTQQAWGSGLHGRRDEKGHVVLKGEAGGPAPHQPPPHARRRPRRRQSPRQPHRAQKQAPMGARSPNSSCPAQLAFKGDAAPAGVGLGAELGAAPSSGPVSCVAVSLSCLAGRVPASGLLCPRHKPGQGLRQTSKCDKTTVCHLGV